MSLDAEKDKLNAKIQWFKEHLNSTKTAEELDAEVTIELADIEKVIGSNNPTKKLFVLSLIKANEQAIHNGQLTKDYISFPLQELVDIGFYKSSNSARAGFFKGADILTSLKIKGEVLFTGARIEKGQCYIFFNPYISWGFLTQYFTILPGKSGR